MKHPLVVLSLGVGVVMVGIYVCVALKRKKTPDLAAGMHVFGSTAGAIGSLRMFALVFSDGISETVLAQAATATAVAGATVEAFALSAEDSIIVCAGALALIWTSIQLISRAFADL